MNKNGLPFEKIGFVLARVIMGAVFLYASYDKILHPGAFAEAVYNYQILPDAAVNAVALVLPWIELVIGLCLVAGVWLPGSVLLAVLLMTVFTAALVFNRIRGLDIHCGCFSTRATHGPAGVGMVLRDLGFLVLSVYLLLRVVVFPQGRDDRRNLFS
ncbi:MAG: MauE/DoxX family redox-associated membrane protein [Desulfosudaceae bacterium]